jgi:hypothetical protein
MTYLIHPACAVWPAMAEGSAELRALADDIGAKGLLSAGVITKDGQLLAGKNRQRACEIAGVEFRVTVYDGDDPEGLTISENKLRRQYTVGQLAAIGEKLATLKNGSNQHVRKEGDRIRSPSSRRGKLAAQKEIAQQLGIHRQRICDMRNVRRDATPAVAQLVESGQCTLDSVKTYARHTPKDKQVADPKVIKREGWRLRKPVTRGGYVTEKRQGVISVPLSDVKQLRSLFKEVREQSTRHIARISTARLRMIASEAERIFRSWTGSDADVGRIADASTEPDDPATVNGE